MKLASLRTQIVQMEQSIRSRIQQLLQDPEFAGMLEVYYGTLIQPLKRNRTKQYQV